VLWTGEKFLNNEGKSEMKVKWSRNREVITGRAGMKYLTDYDYNGVF
jgi:hypothetical protein